MITVFVTLIYTFGSPELQRPLLAIRALHKGIAMESRESVFELMS